MPIVSVNSAQLTPYHSVSDSGGPLDCAYREDRQTPVACDVAQAICEVPFTLAAQARDPVRWNAVQDIRRQSQSLKEFQSIQQPGTRCRPESSHWPRRADRHDNSGWSLVVWYLCSIGRVRKRIDPGTYNGGTTSRPRPWSQGRAKVCTHQSPSPYGAGGNGQPRHIRF